MFISITTTTNNIALVSPSPVKLQAHSEAFPVRLEGRGERSGGGAGGGTLSQGRSGPLRVPHESPEMPRVSSDARSVGAKGWLEAGGATRGWWVFVWMKLRSCYKDLKIVSWKVRSRVLETGRVCQIEFEPFGETYRLYKGNWGVYCSIWDDFDRLEDDLYSLRKDDLLQNSRR